MDVTCLVPREHPSPATVRAKLVAVAERQLHTACARLLRPLCPEHDPSVWFIRRLDTDVAVDAGWDADRLARVWSQALASKLTRTVDGGGDSENALRFENPAAYLAQFLSDLADGVAWSKWYYSGFDGLRALPANAALREALCRDPTDGENALLRLAGDGRSAKVLRHLGESDSRAVLAAFAGVHQNGGSRSEEFNASELRAAWQIWQSASPLLRMESPERAALQFFIRLRQREQPSSSGAVVAAIRAVLSLVRWMTSPRADEMLTTLRDGDMATSVALTRGAEIETLAALFRCERAVVLEIAEQAQAYTSRSASAVVGATETLGTPFGGVFLLLPQLIELDLEECASALPAFGDDSPVSLVRFLVLLKCLNVRNAPRAFFDPILREVTGVAQDLKVDDVRAWARTVTPEMTRDFQVRWAASCYRRGAIHSPYLIVRAARRGRLMILADGERDLWLRAVRSVSELSDAVHALRESGFIDGETFPSLLCDPALVPILPATLDGFPVLAWNSSEAEQLASEDSALSTCLGHARSPDEDLNYLNLTSLLRGARPSDLALSLVAHALLRGFTWRLPGFAWSRAGYLYENFLDVTATIQPHMDRWTVRLTRSTLHVVLTMTGAARDKCSVPWLDQRQIYLTTAER